MFRVITTAKAAASATAVAVMTSTAALAMVTGSASANPNPLPTPGESAACEQAWSPPMDSRVNMRYGLGAIAYYGWVRAQCGGPDARFPNGAAVAGSGLEPDVPAWQRLPPAGSPPDDSARTPGAVGVLG